MEDFVLILREVAYHPKSYLTKLNSRFEATSVVRVTRKEELRKYNKPPIFDDRYLVIFDDVRIFADNKAFVVFSVMFPVIHVESKAAADDAIAICKDSNLQYRIFNNEFSRDDAFRFIQEKASQPVSDAVCKAIIRQVGLSPMRIMTAISVCEQFGYKESVVDHYVDRWMYPDVRKLIECLLGVPRGRGAVKKSLTYLHINRYWFKYVKKTLLEEVSFILQVYRDKLDGKLSSEQVFEYAENEHITRSRVMFALSLYERVSIVNIFVLREFIKSASLLELVLRLVTI